MDLDDENAKSNVVVDWVNQHRHGAELARAEHALERKRLKKLGIKRGPIRFIWDQIKKIIKLVFALFMLWIAFAYVIPYVIPSLLS